MGYTLFISDLHLCESDPEKNHLFFQFLENHAHHADALYILGDFFNVWLGDDLMSDFHEKIAAALLTLTEKNVKIYFMHGNRDFLIGNTFLQKSGCRLLPDPCVIRLYQKPYLLTHGDQFCTNDKTYQLFRHITRHPFTQWLFYRLSQKRRQQFGNKLRNQSEKRNQHISTELMDINEKSLQHCINTIDKHADPTSNHIHNTIHGHTHRPGIHFHFNHLANADTLTIECRTVLSDWSNNEGSYLKITDNPFQMALTEYLC
jgi:UDP-2,3-diacylglucosamine hydrolase